MYAIRVGTDANVDKVDLTVGRQTAEVGLRVEIGCPAVDVVALAGDEHTSLAMWIDSRETADGQLNPLASAIVRVLRPQLTRYYFGPVVIGTSNEHGQIVELSPEHTEILLNALAKASGVPDYDRKGWASRAAAALEIVHPSAASVATPDQAAEPAPVVAPAGASEPAAPLRQPVCQKHPLRASV